MIFLLIIIGVFIIGVILYLVINNNKTADEGRNKADNSVIISTDKKEYKKGQIVKITIRNNTKSAMYNAHGDYIDHIEKYYDFYKDWGSIRNDQLCGAGPFPSPAPVYIKIKPGKFIKQEWDQKESWCEGNITKYEQASTGKYRVRGEVREENGENVITIYSDEFLIL